MTAAIVHGRTPKAAMPIATTGGSSSAQRFAASHRRSSGIRAATRGRTPRSIRGASQRPRVSSSSATGTRSRPCHQPTGGLTLGIENWLATGALGGPGGSQPFGGILPSTARMGLAGPPRTAQL